MSTAKTKSTSSATKKNIYVDADEEITGVIDRVLATNETIVALVVPKRATVFTSIINMKLLKRSADQNNKKVVLITSNKAILPLAGIVGLHVAPNLNSKPYVPSEPDVVGKESSDEPQDEVEIGNTAPVVDTSSLDKEEIEALEVDNTPKSDETTEKKSFISKLKKDKHGTKLKVPNFNKFRLILVAGGLLLIALIVFGYWAMAIAPKAVVNLRGDTETKDLAYAVKADSAVTEANLDEKILPSVRKELKKLETATVPATGQKDNGNKASGTVTLRNCSDNPVNIPAGTGVSTGGFTYITQAPISLPEGDFTSLGICKPTTPTKNVDVIAQQAGDKYNLDSRSYSVAGFSKTTGTGSAMTGGTSQIVKVVSGSDIETAKGKLAEKQVGATEELKASLTAEGYTAIVDTFQSVDGNFVPAPAVDTESNTVTVNVQKTYIMLGIKTIELKKLIEKLAFDGGIDKTKQSILSDGLTEAIYQLGATEGTITIVNISNKIIAGPQLDRDTLKKEIAGKKRGEAEQLLLQRPGIKEVRIDTSPFWSAKVPKKVQKIELIIQDVPNESKP